MTTLHNAAREALIDEALRLAEKMMRDSWATGRDEAWQPSRAALEAHLRAALSEAPGEEREAFEAWWAGLCPAPYYPGIEKEIARNAWQARAMLAASPEAQTVALTDAELLQRLCVHLEWDGYGYWLPEICVKELGRNSEECPQPTLDEFRASLANWAQSKEGSRDA